MTDLSIGVGTRPPDLNLGVGTRPTDLDLNLGVGPVMGVEYPAVEGIWIEDHVINADVTQPELDSVAASVPTRMTNSEILAILER